jgi:hypothetical protein
MGSKVDMRSNLSGCCSQIEELDRGFQMMERVGQQRLFRLIVASHCLELALLSLSFGEIYSLADVPKQSGEGMGLLPRSFKCPIIANESTVSVLPVAASEEPNN